MRTATTSCALVIGIGLLAGCAAGGVSDESSVSREGAAAHTESPLLRTGPKWPGGVVPVCWETKLATDGSGNRVNPHTRSDWATLSANVRDIVNESWGRAANLEFVGWGDCASNDPAKNAGTVAINLADATVPNDRCGDTFIGYDGSSWTRMRLDPDFCHYSSNAADWPEELRGQVMHEFGHALGFQHELDRADNPTHHVCLTNYNDTSADTEGTAFDVDSIMNFSYCPNVVAPYHLSAWDIVGAQNAYGRKQAGAIVSPSNQCVDIPLPYANHGAFLQTFDCHVGSNQSWAYRSNSQLHAPAYSLGTFDVPGGSTANGAQIAVNAPNSPITSNQLWRFDGVRIKGIGDKCLTRNAFQSGAHLSMWTCTASRADQLWSVEPDGRIHTLGGPDALYLDVPNGSATAGNLVQLFPATGGANQRFGMTSLGELTFGGLCLDVVSGNVNDGNPVQLYACKASGDLTKVNQQWHLTGPIHGLGGKCVDVRGAVTTSGGVVQMYACNGGLNQEWDYYFRRD